MSKIIDGKKISKQLNEELQIKVSKLKEKPGIAIVLVGNDPASEIYVSSKEKNCKKIGIHCERHNLPKDTKEMDLLKLVEDLNQKSSIHGILIQLPLPKHISEKLIVDAILPYKDVDGFTPVNLGNLTAGNTLLAPATPRAIVKLIESTGVNMQGKHAVVIGRSNIVGKPVALLLLEKNATVSICHSKTKDLKDITKQADILIAAVGKPKFVKKDMVKQDAIVIDVGINRSQGKIVGDVDFDNVKDTASHITPVPGGVGPMTIALMLDNLVKAKEISDKVLR